MKKAGIITYWKTDDNYGTVLQNYAVQEICRKYGIEATLIRTDFSRAYSAREKIVGNIKSRGIFLTLIKSVKALFARCRSHFSATLNKKRRFSEFCGRYKNQTDRIYSSIKDLEENLPEQDIYIAGSDQIWNVSSLSASDFQAESYLRMIFLDFAPESAKRIACAVSFGTDVFNPALKGQAGRLIQKFDFVSVREKSGVRICGELGYGNAVHHVDPTLLLDKGDYEKLFESSHAVPEREYVLLYLLNNPSGFSMRKFYAWAKRSKLDVVYVNGNLITPKISFRKKLYATVPRWLELVADAKCVFTNSFHGTAFSIIFNKKFMAVPQTGGFEKQNERIMSILDDFGLGSRLLSDGTDLNRVFDEIDYGKVNGILSEKREGSAFKAYLAGCSCDKEACP